METILIYGAGEKGKRLVRQINRYVNKSEIMVNELILVDKDPKKQGTVYMNARIISEEEAIDRYHDNAIMISTIPEYSAELQKHGFSMILGGIDYLLGLAPDCEDIGMFTDVHPFGHYESPYPTEKEIKKEMDLNDEGRIAKDIDLNVNGQAELLNSFRNFEKPQWTGRYIQDNEWFRKPSADALYYMMRFFKPKRIFEIGSGYSTAAMLDVNEQFFDNSISITCVEPYPWRLNNLVRKKDRVDHRQVFLQDLDIELFRELEKNDILFIDSSHVCKHGGDVNYEIFEIFPMLRSGVHIHIHDIFFSFRYPVSWLKQGRAYNEIYILRAFLMNNRDYEIELFSGGGKAFCNSGFNIPNGFEDIGNGSIWIKKL